MIYYTLCVIAGTLLIRSDYDVKPVNEINFLVLNLHIFLIFFENNEINVREKELCLYNNGVEIRVSNSLLYFIGLLLCQAFCCIGLR